MNDDYIKRINTILLYIDANLSGDLSLETIAKIGHYSPFHLHRLFKAITNETLNAYVTRKRIEKAAMQLIHRRELNMLDIALGTGFNSHAAFTRSFTKIYQQSPSQFRKQHAGSFSKIGKQNSKNGKTNLITEEYICNIEILKNWIHMSAKIEVKQMPGIQLAYITHIGVEGLENTFGRMVSWARSKDLLNPPGAHIMRIFYDSFKITDASKVRMGIGVSVTQRIQPDGEIGFTQIAGGKYVVGRFEIKPEEFEKSWNGLFIWMSENGYRKSDKNPYEIYYNNYNDHPEKKCVVDLCIPVE
jgi:AraC family transcriptional regulator